ncbi:hypothetical protein FRC16_008365, partial [Serendipita sp. 398]
MSTARRQQQAPRLARPAQRHFAKKAPRNARDVDDESTDEEQEHQLQDQQQDESVAVGEYGDGEEGEEEEGMVLAGKKVGKEGKAKAKGVRVALGNVQIKDGRVLVNGLEESGRTLVEQ